jgi:hypothetical protein
MSCSSHPPVHAFTRRQVAHGCPLRAATAPGVRPGLATNQTPAAYRFLNQAARSAKQIARFALLATDAGRRIGGSWSENRERLRSGLARRPGMARTRRAVFLVHIGEKANVAQMCLDWIARLGYLGPIRTMRACRDRFATPYRAGRPGPGANWTRPSRQARKVTDCPPACLRLFWQPS